MRGRTAVEGTRTQRSWEWEGEETAVRNRQGKTEARKAPGPAGINSLRLCWDTLREGSYLRLPSLLGMAGRKRESCSVGAGLYVDGMTRVRAVQRARTGKHLVQV